jgi:two-component sensor histidine kinase
MALHMVIHELSTNAAKHGALSSREGGLSVRWSLLNETAQPLLEIVWSEIGGPECRPPQRTGFGSKLLARTVGHQLGGQFESEYDRDGFRCTLRLPWKAIAAETT